MLRRVMPARIWLLAVLLIAGLAVAFYFVLGRGAKSSVVNQLLSRQQVLARSEAANITSFFQVFGKSIAVLSQEVTVSDMDAFVNQWRSSGLVSGIMMAGKNGMVLINSNVSGTRDIGASVGDRDYFLWAQAQPRPGVFFVGQPVISRLGASKDHVIVPVAAAIYEGDVFQGVLSAAVDMGALTEHYLGMMKVSPSTEVYLLDQKGTFLYSTPARDVEGSNVFDQLQNNPFLGSGEIANNLKTRLTNPQEDKLQVAYLDPKTGGLGVRLVAIAPVDMKNQKWLLVMASPLEEALEIVNPIHARQFVILLLTAVVILTFGATVSWDRQKTLSK